MSKQIQKSKESFDDKFGCHKNRKEEVGKHSNYSYQSFLDWHTQQQILLLLEVKKWAEKNEFKFDEQMLEDGDADDQMDANYNSGYNQSLKDLIQEINKMIEENK